MPAHDKFPLSEVELECFVPPIAPPITAAAITVVKTRPTMIQKFRRRTPHILRTSGIGVDPADSSGSTTMDVLLPTTARPAELAKLAELAELAELVKPA